MKFIILTTFPSMYDGFLTNSIIARAISKKLIEVQIVNLRDYTLDKNKRTDTPPIGGGAGLIMKAQPIVDALKANSSNDSLKSLCLLEVILLIKIWQKSSQIIVKL